MHYEDVNVPFLIFIQSVMFLVKFVFQILPVEDLEVRSNDVFCFDDLCTSRDSFNMYAGSEMASLATQAKVRTDYDSKTLQL